MESLSPEKDSVQATDKYEQLKERLQSSVEELTDLVIDFTSLKACLNPMGLTQDSEEETSDEDFDYERFATYILENPDKTLPKMNKLTVRRMKIQSPVQQDQYAKLTHSMTQLSMLSELDLSHVPQQCHKYLQLWGLSNIQTLSITDSELTTLPSSVGSLRDLRTLSLSTNKLTTLPTTLSFCQKLETLNLQRNSFRLLPSVLLKLRSLATLRRHGSSLSPPHNWYGPRFVHKVAPKAKDNSGSENKTKVYQPLSLQASCTKEIFAMKIDYWETSTIGILQCRTMDSLAEKFYACDSCGRMLENSKDASTFGVSVLMASFKELSGVPFGLCACSENCQNDLVSFYGDKNIELQKELDDKYQEMVKAAQEEVDNGLTEELPQRTYSYQSPYNFTSTSNRRRRRKKCSIM